MESWQTPRPNFGIKLRRPVSVGRGRTRRRQVLDQMTSQAKDVEPARKRQRKAKSCEQCRTRKVRCDMASPCGPCQCSRDHLSCTYRDLAHSATSPDIPPRVALTSSYQAAHLVPPDPKLQELENRIRRLEGQVASHTQSTPKLAANNHKTINPLTPRLLITTEKVKLFGPSH